MTGPTDAPETTDGTDGFGERDVPAGWTVWNEGDDGRVVLVYRPDVFDAAAFPPACLPTVYVTHGRRTRRPGRNPTDRTGADDWYVSATLEPDVSLAPPERFPKREAALESALDLAARFATGDVAYRDRYQVPRDDYLATLDELTGRDTATNGADDPDS